MTGLHHSDGRKQPGPARAGDGQALDGMARFFYAAIRVTFGYHD
jgi:hypothetical protein